MYPKETAEQEIFSLAMQIKRIHSGVKHVSVYPILIYGISFTILIVACTTFITFSVRKGQFNISY